jgi:AmmeMemoRadiSam system protein A
MMHPAVRLAKKTVEDYVKTGKVTEKALADEEEMNARAGVFVSLKKRGLLRGCIGTILPQCDTVAEEIVKNAVSAATCDPRFQPVGVEELDDIVYSVDILTMPERVDDISGLDPKSFGVIVSKDVRKGVLLPDLEGVDSVEEQLRIATAKAGIGPDEEGVSIESFKVKRYK